jgi:hypothetical protein
MHRVWDFTEEVGDLTELESAHFAQAAEAHRRAGQTLTGVITAVGPDTFTIREDDDRTSTWPLRGWMSDYRRGLRCQVRLGSPGADEVIGIGEPPHLRYVTLPGVAEIWVESRGVSA